MHEVGRNPGRHKISAPAGLRVGNAVRKFNINRMDTRFGAEVYEVSDLIGTEPGGGWLRS